MRLTSRSQDAIGLYRTRSRVPRGWALAGITAAMLAVFWLDRVTDAAPVQHLYYAPIILAAVRFRTRGGLLASLAAIVLYHLANPRILTFPYAHGDIVQVLLFVGIGVVTARLASDTRRLRRLATTDDLTGLHNLRSFEAHLQHIVEDAHAAGAPLSMLVLDVDHLKPLNDRHGHLTGAEAVRTVGHIVGDMIGSAGVACRYGGDEFVVALPRLAAPQALLLANRLREAVAAASPTLAGRFFPAGTLSISIGLACRWFDESDGEVAVRESMERAGEALFRAADGALYAAKNGGRNRVVVRDTRAEARDSRKPGPKYWAARD